MRRSFNFERGVERIHLPRKAVDISIRSGLGAALFKPVRWFFLTKDKLPCMEELPRSIAMTTVLGGVSLGEDLVWRSWLNNDPERFPAQFPTEGILGRPSAVHNQLLWIGGDGKPRINYIGGATKPDNLSLLRQTFADLPDPVLVHLGSSITAVKEPRGSGSSGTISSGTRSISPPAYRAPSPSNRATTTSSSSCRPGSGGAVGASPLQVFSPVGEGGDLLSAQSAPSCDSADTNL